MLKCEYFTEIGMEYVLNCLETFSLLMLQELYFALLEFTYIWELIFIKMRYFVLLGASFIKNTHEKLHLFLCFNKITSPGPCEMHETFRYLWNLVRNTIVKPAQLLLTVRLLDGSPVCRRHTSDGRKLPL